MSPQQELTLEGAWEAYQKIALPAHAPQAQREMMYQAFLVGVDTLAQVYQAAQQHTPSNVRTIMSAWKGNAQGELKRMAQETRN